MVIIIIVFLYYFLYCHFYLHLIHKLDETDDQDEIDDRRFSELSRNQSIVQLNREMFQKRMTIIREELMMTVFHPKRLERYLEMGYDIFDEIYI